jgi:hypothetical protein
VCSLRWRLLCHQQENEKTKQKLHTKNKNKKRPKKGANENICL